MLDSKGIAATEFGDGGNDTYVFNAGYDGVTVVNGSPMGGAPDGTLQFGAGLDSGDLWFVQQGQNLVIDQIGKLGSVTVNGWFGSNTSAALAEIVGGDGLRLDAGVGALVGAMSAYQAAHPGFNPVLASAMPGDAALQAAIGAAWHA